jgi:P4 family phage/plasmid primase-like protien
MTKDPPESENEDASIEIRDKVGLLANERLFGPHFISVPLRTTLTDPRLDAERIRLLEQLAQIRVELGPDGTFKEAYRMLRDRELPDWRSPLLALPEDGLDTTGESNLFDADSKPVRVRFVEKLMAEFPFRALRDNGDLYVYIEGYFSLQAKPLARAWIEKKFQSIGQTATGQFTTEVIESICRRSYTDRRDFNPPVKLCLKNGILDLGTLTVSPHTPDLQFTFQLPVVYDENATCPAFDRFIREVVPDTSDRDAIQMLFGYCLEPGNPHQTAFLTVGGGNNGKTTCLSVLRDLLGKESVSAETLQSLSEGRFGTSGLFGKLANICTDIPASPIRYTGTFKMLTGGDSVRAERKFADTFWFVNPAKLIFSANELPPVLYDTSYAFWRRWVIIEFPVDLTGREDRSLPARLQKELPGILNFALEGLRKLRLAGGFPTAKADGLKELWRRCSEPLYWFVAERVVIEASAEVPKVDFYEAYNEFATDHNLPVLGQEQVGTLISKYVPSIRAIRHRHDGRAERYWSGVRLRTSAPPPATPDAPDTPARLRAPPEISVSGVASESGGPYPGSTAPAEPGSWQEGPVRSRKEGDL